MNKDQSLFSRGIKGETVFTSYGNIAMLFGIIFALESQKIKGLIIALKRENIETAAERQD